MRFLLNEQIFQKILKETIGFLLNERCFGTNFLKNDSFFTEQTILLNERFYCEKTNNIDRTYLGESTQSILF